MPQRLFLLLPAVLLLVAPAAPLELLLFDGFTLDPCRLDSECVAPRRCEQLVPFNATALTKAACNRRSPLSPFPCSCRLPTDRLARCATSSDCVAGERCVLTKAGGGCISCRFFRADVTIPSSAAVDNATLDQCPPAAATPTPPGLPYDPCTSQSLPPPPSPPVASCRYPAVCAVGTARMCRPGDVVCTCLVLQPRPCNTSADCDAGTRCAVPLNGGMHNGTRECVGCHAARYGRVTHGLVEASEPPSCARDIDPVSDERAPGDPALPCDSDVPPGLEYDHCCPPADASAATQPLCAFPRSCIARNETLCTPGTLGCLCRSPGVRPPCDAGNPCPRDEGCFRHTNGTMCMSCRRARTLALIAELDGGACPSPEPSETPEPTDGADSSAEPSTGPSVEPSDTPLFPGSLPEPESASEPPAPSVSQLAPVSEVCMDATLLHKWPRGSLVYARARRAVVLCDRYGTCATGGHVVLVGRVRGGGVAMTMRRFCAERAGARGCTTETRWVNSPRWRAGLRVAPRARFADAEDGAGAEEGEHVVALSAHAARWESRVEEHVLAALVRVRL